MELVDWLIVGAFVCYAIYTGIRHSSQAKLNLNEYFLAGKSIEGWKSGLSMAATQFAADTPLMVVGLIATVGVFGLWRLWVYGIAFLLMGFVLGPCWRRATVLTDAELTEFRYSSPAAAYLRAFKAVYLGTFFNCVVLAMVLLAATRICEPFFLWSQWLPEGIIQSLAHFCENVGIKVALGTTDQDIWIRSASNVLSLFVIILATLFYSTAGGLRSVVQTDIIQFFIGLSATLAFCVYVVNEVGGLGAIGVKLDQLFPLSGNDMTPGQLLGFTPWEAKGISIALLTSLGIQWIAQVGSDGTGPLAQRTMACKSVKDAKIAAVVFTYAQILVRSLIWVPLGIGLLILFPPSPDVLPEAFTANREGTFVRGMAELLPTGLRGLMLAGMLAALASTVDTHLNWGASYWTNDLYSRLYCDMIRKRKPSNRALVIAAKISNICIIGIAFYILCNLSSIHLTFQISLLLGASLGVPLILRWIWWRANAWTEIASIVTSLIISPIAIFVFPDVDFNVRMLVVAGISLAVAIGITYITPAPTQKHLQTFFSKVKPPGFWKPIAKSLGEDPRNSERRFYNSFAATLVCSLSVFCLLVGIGGWMVGSKGPQWAGHPLLWQGVLVVIGIGLCPIWWKLGMNDE